MTARRCLAVFRTCAGWVIAEASGKGITRISLPVARKPAVKASPGPASARGHILTLKRQLRSYLAGRPVRFKVALDLSSLPEFTRAVLRAASRIPRGQVTTYADLARAVGKPAAARAVGQAMKRNPVPVVIPCHRVVASNGLGGYSAGLAWKRRLLRLEGGR